MHLTYNHLASQSLSRSLWEVMSLLNGLSIVFSRLSPFPVRHTIDTSARYLTAVDEGYYNTLSDASKKSLELQGGPFQGEKLEEFERDELREEMVRLRKWDDGAKVVGAEEKTPRAERYLGMIVSVLEG